MILTLCEVQVFGIYTEAPFNLALGKPAVQSSYRFKGEPSNAVDGNTNGDYMAKSCSHTKAPYEKNPWWRVDLGSSYLITHVVVYNRNDCCSGRLRNMEIRIGTSLSNNGNNNRAVATGESLRFRRMKSYTFAPVVGRYVNIALIGRNMTLTLCEVQVFGIYTDIKYFIEGGKQSCDTICQKRGLECSSTYHGFMNINILDIFRDKGKNCITGFDTDVYTYDDNPVYIATTSGWGRRCVGWKDVRLKIKCWDAPRYDHTQRLCPCRKGKCERRWRTFGKSTYRFCNVQKTRWIDAQAACQNLGADLVKIDTNAENEFVRTTVRVLSMLNIWIGLRRGWENQFYWTDGSRPQYSSLSSGQVEDSGEQEDCAKAFDGRWNEVLCDTTQHANSFVCEKQKCQNASETVQNLTFDNNSSVTSSSRDQNHSSFYGILKKSFGIWCPQSKSTIEWLTVDLRAPYFICGVAAVNDFKTRNETAVTWYKVILSLEAIAGDTNEYSSSQEFRTDNSSDNVQVKELHGIARYLKFSPTRWNTWPCMKIAVYADGQVQPLRMTYGLRNKTVEHISSTTLRCFAHGYPFPTYSWTKDGSTVISNGKLSEKNTVLRLSPLNFENEGWYTCTANTSLGSVNSSAYLTVHAKPIYIKVNSPVTAKTGQDAVLSCENKAFPAANVTWTKSGRVISNDSQYSVSSEYIQSSNILINNLTIHNVSVFDVEIYICTFSNYLGSLAGQIEVQIVDDCRPIVFDFENGESSLKGWGRTGIAFNNQPTYGDNLKIRHSSYSAGQQGKYWIGSFENRPSPSSPAGAIAGNAPQGTLTSPEFQITGPNVSFLIGGYCQSSFLQLLVGGKVVQNESGDCQFGMKRKSWNIQNNYIGKKARLRLLDFSSSNWGHVSFDDFRGDIALCKGCMQPLGITNRVIPDFAMTASSMWDVNHSPIFGRLYTLRRDGHVGSWSSKVNRGGQWIQVDVGATTAVTKVATQGRSDLSQWVRSYYLKYSTDGSNFHRYNKLLRGNFDRNTIVENVLSSPVRGRYFRIYPQSWYRHMSLRMELYGCPIEPAVPTIQSYGIINETTAKEGDVVNLYCAAKGYPYVSYRWTRNGEKKELAVGQRLFFPVKPEDDGVYVCTAFNTAGTTQLRIRLHVSNPLRDYSSMSMTSTCNKETGSNSTILPQYDNSLFVATKTHIEQVSWEFSEDRFVIKKRKSYNTSAVDVALFTEKSNYWVYWTDGESIQKQNVNQNDQESTDATVVYNSRSTPGGIAVDWISKKLYWTDQNLNKIVAVDLQNDHRSVVVLDSLSYPRAITLDPQQGYMYWTEWGGESARIARAGMDGSNIESVVTQDIWQPNGLAIDYYTKRLYWTDSNGTLQSSWLNGTNRLTIVNETGKFEPYGVAVWNGYVLWSDRKTNALYSVSEHGEIHDMVHGLDRPSGMEIVYPGNQPKGINPCRKYNAGCSYMCLLSPGKRTFSCVCRSNQVLAKDGKTCEEKSKTVSSSYPPSNTAIKYLAYILICLVVFLTIWLIISYVKYNRKMSNLLLLLKLRQKYGNHPNERTEPTEITAASLTAECNNRSTIANQNGNQETEKYRGNSGIQPEEQNLLQNGNSTVEETSSSEAQKLTWITIKHYPKYLTRQYGGVAVIGDDAKAYCKDVQRQSSVDSLDAADDAV